MLCPYKLRIDLETVSVDSVLNVVKDSKCYAYVVEGSQSENPHIHFYLLTEVKNLTLRARIRKLDISGNKAYSLKKLDEDYPIEYFAYMMKEGKVTWVNVEDKYIQEATAYDLKIKQDMKKKKSEKLPVWKQIMESMPPREDDSDLTRFRDSVAQAVVDYHIEKSLVIRKFQIISYVDTICCHLSDLYKQRWIYDLVNNK